MSTAINNSIWFEGRAGKTARLAIVTGILVHLAGFLAFRIVTEPAPQVVLPAPFVNLSPSVQATEELLALAALSDSEPLFLPTIWNANSTVIPTSLLEINTSPFDIFPAEIVIDADRLSPPQPDSIPSIVEPREALDLYPGLVFSSFGSQRRLSPTVADRGVNLEILDIQTRNLVKTAIIDNTAIDVALPPNWRFAEYKVLVGPTGILGAPLLLTSTDSEELDRALASYLSRFLNSADLSEGYYQVIIGP